MGALSGSRSLGGAAIALALVGCASTPKPPAPPAGPAVASSGTTTVGVVWIAPTPTSLPKWKYEVSDTAAFNRVTIDLGVQCRLPTAPSSTITPSPGPSASWVFNYILAVTSATITIPCDAANGGSATVKVLSTTGTTVTGPTLTVLGPR